MREFFTNGLHLFIMAALVSFVIFCTLALSGRFDHWDSRFIKKAQLAFSRVRRFFQRKHKREEIIHQNPPHDEARHEHHANHVTHSNKEGDVQ
jgi:hypothetical protein